MVGHVEAKDASSTMPDSEPDEQDPEAHHRDSKEVHRRDRIAMIPQEHKPALDSIETRGRRGIYRETVRSDTSKPSMSSSPWILGAPQVAFSVAIRRIRSRMPRSIGGRLLTWP